MKTLRCFIRGQGNAAAVLQARSPLLSLLALAASEEFMRYLHQHSCAVRFQAQCRSVRCPTALGRSIASFIQSIAASTAAALGRRLAHEVVHAIPRRIADRAQAVAPECDAGLVQWRMLRRGDYRPPLSCPSRPSICFSQASICDVFGFDRFFSSAMRCCRRRISSFMRGAWSTIGLLQLLSMYRGAHTLRAMGYLLSFFETSLAAWSRA